MIGRVFAGTYLVDRALGEGGMGTVYEVTHLRTSRRYAMKLVRSEATQRAGADARFRREAEAIGKLRHANVIGIHDFDVFEGTAFLVMELLEGESLEARLGRVHQLSVDDALRIFREIAAGIEAAHAAGMIHRDLKPANVFLATFPGAPERAVVLDFGLAKAWEDPTQQALTSSGMVIGTPQYMSPEQASGLALDERTDLYALATILFEMLAGKPPLDAPTLPALFARLLTDPPASVRLFRAELPPALDLVFARALAKSKEDRYPNARSLVSAVHDAFDARAPIAATRELSRATRKRPVALLALVVFGLLCGLSAGASMIAFLPLRDERAPEPRRRAIERVEVAPAEPIAVPVPIAVVDAGACTTVLGCAASCDEVIGSPLLDESFDADAPSFRRVQGAAHAVEGAYRVGGSAGIAIVDTRSPIAENIAACVDARLPAMRPSASRYEALVGLRSPRHGLSFNFRGTDHRIGLLSIGPPVRPIDRDECPWIGEDVRVRIFLWLDGERAYAEIQRADTGEVQALSGVYLGPWEPWRVEIEMHAADPMEVHRVLAGIPTARARAVALTD
jgi:tRNA A-37 threonylcarbamoyl transferase component Bud32